MPGRFALRRECERLATKLNVTIERDNAGSVYTLSADAPVGSVFAANFNHTLVSTGRYASWKDAESVLYADLLERLKYELAVCDDPDCDCCNPEGESEC